MCKERLTLTLLILLLGSISIAEDIRWTGAGRNKLWRTGINWDLGRPPTLAEEVRIDVPGAAAPNGPIIQEGIDAQVKVIFTEADGEPTLTMTGGTLEVSDWILWGGGMDSYAIWTMTGGTVTVANDFWLGCGGGAGTLIMTGGTINVGKTIIPTGSGAFGELFLYGGTYNVTKPGGFEVNANGLIDITQGTLVLEGDETAKINGLAAAGLITALGGEGILNVDYDVRKAGKTTVTGAPEPGSIKPDAAGLLAYYALENNTYDSSGNELHGTLAGDPTFVKGAVGMALDFDGVGDYVNCGNSPLFDLTEQFTVAAWVSIRSVPGEWLTVIAKGDGAWRISTNSSTRRMHFGITDRSGYRETHAANSNTVLPLNEWHHVCGTYDLQNGARIYIDGELDGTNPNTAGINRDAFNVYIGDNSQWTGRFWDGLIDEVVIYDRALSEGEVLYLAGASINTDNENFSVSK